MVLIQNVLALILTLGILVTIHEFGHYLIARWSGVRILRFCVGFGKPFASWTDRRGTEWAIAAIPLGGYLRMWDERDPLGAHSAAGNGMGSSHNELSPLWRIAIAFGGPFANFLLTCVLFWALFVAGTTALLPLLGTPLPDSPAAKAGMRGGEEIVAVDGVAVVGWQDIGMALLDRLGETGEIQISTRRPGASESVDYQLQISDWQRGADEPEVWQSLGLNRVTPAVVGEITSGSPAERAGLQFADLVVGAGGEPVANWSDWVAVVKAHPGKSLVLNIERRGRPLRITVTPEAKTAADGTQYGLVGVRPAERTVSHGIVPAIPMAIAKTGDSIVSMLGTLKKMITGAVSTKNLSGPITIAQVAGVTLERGIPYYVQLLALLSLSLGVINLMPIPMLDGGQIVFYTAELLRGKPLSERAQVIGFQIGIVLVGGLMVLALSNDISRLLGSL